MNRCFILCISLFVSSCTDDDADILFTKVSVAHSKLEFSNTITESEELNILDYEYLYNGGGVAIGDFDSDGLQDVFFIGNMVGSRLYLNRGGLEFEDVTESSGIGTFSWCTGVSVVDINADGRPDIHVASAHKRNLERSANYFFINQTKHGGPLKFENRAKEMNLADDSYSIQAAWLDYDLDGDLDLFLTNNSEEEYPKNNPLGQKTDASGRSTDKLYQNQGIKSNGLPHFKDISTEASITVEGWSLGVIVLDINTDSYPDLYVANDFVSNDLLYINNGNGTFSNKIADYLKHQSHNSMGVDASDINNDGHLDLLVLDMLPENNLRHKTMFGDIPYERFQRSLERGYQPQFVRNVLQINNGDGSFSDLGQFSGLSATDWSWSPLIADFDNDGQRDVYITNGYRKDITDMDFVDYNNKTSSFGTVDEKRNDLLQQLKNLEGTKKSNVYFENRGGNKFEERTNKAGLEYPSYTNGATYADLDNDGDLELVMNNIDDPVLLFENLTNDPGPKNTHYFRLGLPIDASGLGAKVSLYTGSEIKFAEFYPQRGYLSSSEPYLHFGLGEETMIDSLKIVWPSGRVQLLKEVSVDQVMTLKYHEEASTVEKVSRTQNRNHRHPTYFSEIPPSSSISHVHRENTFDDFKKWPLHFRSYSKNGPVMATGDVNGDDIEDVYIGGPAGSAGRLYLRKSAEEFEILVLGDSIGRRAEDTSAVFFDADNDGDVDLYCTSGSSEHYTEKELYQDRLYQNDGQGTFSLREGALPTINSATNVAVPLDYDRDGDLDLFVGGRVDAANYPLSPRSYLLRNDGDTFADVTFVQGKDLAKAGMISDARPADIDGDGWTDLLLVGEWMPIQVFYNQKGKFVLDDSANGLAKTNGLWNCLDSSDFDGDGDIDFIAGNWGLNNPFTASENYPVSLYAADYDQNGTIEAIMTYFNAKREYIRHPRGTLARQLPMLNNAVHDYSTYGSLTYPQIFDSRHYGDIQIFRTFNLASSYIENRGDGSFRISNLPDMAQRSPIFDFLVTDVNEDGHPDILSVGNFRASEVLGGWYDSGNGAVLLGDGSGNFKTALHSGFTVPGEARSIRSIGSASDSELILVGLQEDSLQTFARVRAVVSR